MFGDKRLCAFFGEMGSFGIFDVAARIEGLVADRVAEMTAAEEDIDV